MIQTAVWQQDAACRGMTHVMFPPLELPIDERRVAEAQARALCARCPVAQQCRGLWDSLPTQMQVHGVWAGMRKHRA